jgi:flavin-dependent dehydrogenase
MLAGMLEVIIVGGGPAGSVAAILLARAGSRVTVIEQHTFPRDKVCGACVSPLGVDVLERFGVFSELEKLRPTQLTRAAFHADDIATVNVPLARPMIGISRLAMDQVLLQAARDAGARIVQPARCEQLLIDAATARPRVRWRCLSSNRLVESMCDWVILADGKAASADLSSDFGIKAHFTAIDGPRDAVEMFGVDGHYAGLASIENDRWNLACSVPVGRLKQCSGDVERLFRTMLQENRALSARMKGAKRVTRWLSAPLPRFAVAQGPRWSPRVIPVGNAAAALEPIGGEGIGLAIRSAELAAEALISHRSPSNGAALADLPRRFDELWRRRSLGCRMAARLLSHSELAQALAPLLSNNPRLPQSLMAWMR